MRGLGPADPAVFEPSIRVVLSGSGDSSPHPIGFRIADICCLGTVNVRPLPPPNYGSNMSSIARIFIVLNLLLTALVLGWSSNLLKVDQDYKQQLADLQESSDAVIAGKDGEITLLNTEVSTQKEASGRNREQRDAAAAARDALQSQLDLEREKCARAEATTAKFSQTITGIDEGRKATQEKADQAMADKTEAVDARREAESASKDAGDAKRAAEEDLAEANRQIAAHETTIATLAKDLGKSETIVAVLVDKYNVDLTTLTAQPDINGAVVAVSDDVKPGLLGINRGKADGVKRGYVFSIYNGSKLKGRARVETVEDNMCFAVVESVFENRTFSTGDIAATRL